jgi:putative salt-induced outer membrane protein
VEHVVKNIRVAAFVWIPVLLQGAIGSSAAADEESKVKLGWSSAAEVGFVLTSGNSESKTLGFSDTTRRQWTKALLELKLGALKVETTSDLGVAIGTPTDYSIPEVTATTAENYYLGAKYDRNISERLFWYAAAGWLRNEFAGIQNRTVVSAGMGNVWIDREKLSFRTSYGISNTDQKDVVKTPSVETRYFGLQANSGLRKKFGERSEYGNDFVFNYSLADSDNWRWVMDQWVTASLTEKLALKATLQWLFNNFPAFQELTLLEGDPPTDLGNTVLVQLSELDTIFSVSLVVNF